MKVEELMIGDWVHKKIYLNGRDIPPYEEDVQIFNIYGNLLNCVVRDYTIISGSYLDGFEPIALTKEILLANGFLMRKRFADESDSFYTIIRDKNDNTHRVDIENEYTKIDYENYLPKVKYVHELQHALRICGLNELADNFVIR